MRAGMPLHSDEGGMGKHGGNFSERCMLKFYERSTPGSLSLQNFALPEKGFVKDVFSSSFFAIPVTVYPWTNGSKAKIFFSTRDHLDVTNANDLQKRNCQKR